MNDLHKTPFGPPADPTTTPVRLYGGPTLFEDEEEVALSPQQEAFLTVVAVHGGSGVSRSRVAWLMWEEDAEEPARRRISQLLYGLKKRTSISPVVTDGDDLKPSPDRPSDLDCLRLRKALRPVTGKPLGKLKPPHATGAFEKWLTTQRTTLRYLAIERNGELLASSEENHDYELVTDAARALLEYDPVNERALRSLVRALALSRSALQAEAAYRHQVEIVARILPDWAPSQETRRLLGEIDSLRRRQAGPPTSRDIQHAVRLVGRRRELTTLREYALGPGAPYRDIMIVGDPGVGKSRLLEELGRQLSLDDCRLVRVRSYAAEEGIAFNFLSDIARSEPFQEAIRNIAPLWRQVLSMSLTIEPVDVPEEELPEVPAESAARRAYEALRHLFDSVEGRVVILADGFGAADSSSLAALAFLRRRIKKSTIRLIGTVGRDAIRRTDSQAQYLQSLLEEVDARLEVEALSEDESAELLRAAREETLEARNEKELVRLAGGNPLFLIELAQGEEGAIPRSLNKLHSKRLSRLQEGTRAILKILSAQSGPTALDLLGRIAGQSVSEILVHIDEALAHRLVTHASDSIDFQHGLFKAWVYRELTEPERRLIHAATRDQLQLADASDFPAELAYHCLAAGDHKNAFHWAQICVKRAEGQAAIPHVIRFLDTVWRSASDPTSQSEALAKRGRLLFLQGRTKEALEALDQSLELGPPTESSIESRILRSRAALEAGIISPHEAINALGELQRQAIDEGNQRSALAAMDAQLVTANEHLFFDQVRRTLSDLDNITWGQTAELRCRVALLRSFHFLYGERREGLQATDEAVDLARTHHLDDLFPSALSRQIITHSWDGCLDEGRVSGLLSLAKDIALRTGDQRQRLRAMVNLSTWYLDILEPDKALNILLECDELVEDSEIALRVYLDLNWAEYHLLEREIEVATELFRRAADSAVRVRPDLYPATLAGYGLCCLGKGQLSDAKQVESELHSLRPADSSVTNSDLTLVYRFRARTLEVMGNWREAQAVLSAGQEVTQKLHIPGWLRLVLWKQEMRQKHGAPIETAEVQEALSVCDKLNSNVIARRLRRLVEVD